MPSSFLRSRSTLLVLSTLFIARSGFRSAAAILLLGWVGSSEVLATPSEPMPGSIQDAKDEDGPKGSTTCPLEKGRLLCPLPAGIYDLRLYTEGFVPLYAWGVEIPRGRPPSSAALD